MTDYVDARKDEFIPATLETITYDGKIWGVPRTSDAGFLYYRTDQVKRSPTTWQEVYASRQGQGRHRLPGRLLRGPDLRLPRARLRRRRQGALRRRQEVRDRLAREPQGAEFMVDGIKDGAAPKAVTTYMEEQARRAFEAGSATFERNWPYAYALGKKDRRSRDKFEVAPFPDFEGGGKAGILGGHNDVISVYSKNPGGALKFIDYLTSRRRSMKPTRRVLAAAGDRRRRTTTRRSRRRCRSRTSSSRRSRRRKSRPVSPVYPQISAGDLQERQRGAVGRRIARGGAEEGADRRWNRP